MWGKMTNAINQLNGSGDESNRRTTDGKAHLANPAVIKNSVCMVTGGAGFIGSHLIDTLAAPALHNHVVVLDNLSTGKLANIAHHFMDNEAFRNLIKDETRGITYANASRNKEEQKEALGLSSNHVTFIKGDITDLALLQNIFQKYKPQFVFHQAAIPSVPRSVKDPVKSNNANVNGTLNVLVSARDANVKKVVYASSSSVYGDTPTLPKKEDMKPCPLSPYAVSKLAGEYYCKVFTECYGIKTVALRYFNVYGARQDPSSAYAAVVPKFITSALNKKAPTIYGDGEQTRDFTYVQDVVNANMLAAASNATGVFNVAGGKRITINGLADTIIDFIQTSINPIYEDPRPGDILHSLADISKAKQEIGYEPFFEVQNGLKETILWY